MRAAKPVQRFVRALLGGGACRREGASFRVDTASGSVLLPASEVRQLQAKGVLGGDGRRAIVLPETAGWLKRQMLDDDAFAAQHRQEVAGPDHTVLNLAESPLARLATASAEEPAFLERHHVEAGERLRHLLERARLGPRLTMNYSAAQIASKGTRQGGELSDMAADARRSLARLYSGLPRECAEVLIDVCGFEKGLQQIESERGWPRRSAKLVLRIALDRLAEVWGIGSVAVGGAVSTRHWMFGERSPLWPEDE